MDKKPKPRVTPSPKPTLTKWQKEQRDEKIRIIKFRKAEAAKDAANKRKISRYP